ncbi:hypothetical protein FACHB389_29340 [Nostoc calcicola FACHB-389]|nr:hypothetical protein [Nostoc calcicola FACHB-3891]OKH25713.1 hypothetical protein FACHB389_29340 [Nostoc calcicola FACHB-389]
MNLTEIEPVDIIMHIEQNFNRAQTTGLNCLIFLSLREETSVAYQLHEWGFHDIPEYIVAGCDSLGENDLIELATEIATSLLDELVTNLQEPENGENTTAALVSVNAEPVAVQAIEPEYIAPLLSDYSPTIEPLLSDYSPTYQALSSHYPPTYEAQ